MSLSHREIAIPLMLFLKKTMIALNCTHTLSFFLLLNRPFLRLSSPQNSTCRSIDINSIQLKCSCRVRLS